MLLILLSLLSCRRGDTQDSQGEAEDPWLDYPVQVVDDFRPMLVTKLPGSRNQALLSIPTEPLLVVLDTGGTWVVDDRYEIREAAVCLDTDRFPDVPYSNEHQGDCGPGEVELDRGRAPPMLAAAVDLQEKLLWGVGPSGRLLKMDYDLRRAHPWDWLRAEVVAELGRTDIVDAQMRDGQLQLLAGDELLTVDTLSFTVSTELLPAPGTVLSSGAVGSGQGLILDGVLQAGEPVLDIAESDEGLWLALGAAGIQGPNGEELADSATRVVVAERGVYVVGSQGLWRIEEGAAELLLEGSFVDVIALPSHEIVVLAPGEVQVYVDERPLLEGPPLSLWVQTFLEKPRTPADVVPCSGGVENVEGYVRSGASNARLLADIPASVALDVTPFFAKRVQECELGGPVQGLLDQPNLELGVLYHEAALCRGNQECLVGYLEEGLAEVETLAGRSAGHVSGLNPIWDDGDDWVAGLIDADVPKLITFVGMSVLPEVIHLEDPRAKERWPLEMADMAQPWSISSAEEPDVDAGGPIRILPSNTRAAFSQEGCGSLLLRECFVLNIGAGQGLSERDIVQLDLSLHRALAFRGDQGVWSFHMPDLGSWDYVEGCDEDWEGGCDGARFRDWLIDVHARWVQGGAAQWSLPAEHE